ncbi:MAG: hypothetical protein J7642_19795 [Cyanobacteria bacterium SBC]|nr:hypothetical protein [Cyanobacteria bacterium SBC]
MFERSVSKRLPWIVVLSIVLGGTFGNNPARANLSYSPVWTAIVVDELYEALLPSREPLDVEQLDAEVVDSDSVIRRDTISQTGLTEPSLWWAAEQFGGKLLENWLAYPQKRRIDLVVNRQLWSLLTYLERYQFVNRMGTIARSYRYNLRVLDRQQPDFILAAYTCHFQIDPVLCNVDLERGSQSEFRTEAQSR